MIGGIFIGIIIILTAGGCVFLNRPSFGRLPRGERLERIKRSPQYKDGEFRNRHPTELMTSDKGRWQSIWNFLFSKPERLTPSVPIPTIKTNLKELDRNTDLLVWFGHSSYLLQLSGKRICCHLHTSLAERAYLL